MSTAEKSDENAREENLLSGRCARNEEATQSEAKRWKRFGRMHSDCIKNRTERRFFQTKYEPASISTWEMNLKRKRNEGKKIHSTEFGLPLWLTNGKH